METMRIAVVGAGNIAQSCHLSSLDRLAKQGIPIVAGVPLSCTYNAWAHDPPEVVGAFSGESALLIKCLPKGRWPCPHVACFLR